MKRQEESEKKEPKASTSSEQGGAAAAASSGGDFGDASQYEELNPIGTGKGDPLNYKASHRKNSWFQERTPQCTKLRI